MAEIRASIEINRSPATVFEYLRFLENQPEWMTSILTSELTSGEAGSVDAEYRQVMKAMGQEMVRVVEVVKCERNHLVLQRSKGGPMTVEMSFAVTPMAEGSEVSVAMDAGRMTVMLRPMVKPQLKEAVVTLKELLESR